MSNPSFPWPLPLGQMQAAPTGTAPAVTEVAPAPTPPAANQPPAGAPVTAAPGAAPTTGPTTGPARQPSFLDSMGGMIFLVPIVIVFYLLVLRGPRKQEKQRKLMMADMKKGDRVMTIGGLVARVVSIDNDEVVLKIDESANVKATYKKSSIQQVLPSGDEKTK